MRKLAILSTSILFSLIIALLTLEIALNIHNPIRSSVRGSHINLTRDIEWRFVAPKGSVLKGEIVHRKNDIGFRGPDYIESENKIKIFSVGGSTTENSYLDEKETWSAVLYEKLSTNFRNIWLNNAGFSGHSTYGHKLLMENYLTTLQPDVVIFLVGINDVNRDDLESNELDLFRSAVEEMALHSEVFSLALNIYRHLQAQNRHITHNIWGIDDDWLVTSEIDPVHTSSLLGLAKKMVEGYRSRVASLVADAHEIGALVILATQPVLYGYVIDDRSGLDLSKIYVDGVDGGTAWELLELYNAQTRLVAKEMDVPLVDLAREMPKSSSLFYDTIHFTPKGAEFVAEKIYLLICEAMMNEFRDYSIEPCPN